MPNVKSVSGAIAANVVVTAVSGVNLFGFTVNPAAAGAHTVTLFDNATTSTGTILFSETTTTAANDSPLVFTLPSPIRVANGITLSVATTAVGDISVWVE